MTMTDPELRQIRDSIKLVGKLSDSLVKLGPFSLGIDGVLSWAPGLGEIYSACAGLFILIQGLRAQVSWKILALATVLLGLRTFGDAIPLAGPLFADLFVAHRWSANMIVAAIDRKLERAEEPRGARWWGRSAAIAA
jgi:hypothetical protein